MKVEFFSWSDVRLRVSQLNGKRKEGWLVSWCEDDYSALPLDHLEELKHGI